MDSNPWTNELTPTRPTSPHPPDGRQDWANVFGLVFEGSLPPYPGNGHVDTTITAGRSEIDTIG